MRTAEPNEVRQQTTGMPIGVSDKKGVPICVGDTLQFDSDEWGGHCEFMIRVKSGEILGYGTPSDWSEFCAVVKRFDQE